MPIFSKLNIEQLQLIRTWKQEPENPVALLGYCRLLADILRLFTPGDEQTSKTIHVGSQIFSGLAHIVNTVYDTVSKVLSLDPTSVQFNVGVASLATSNLPYWCRASPLGRLCLERAMLFNPDSSKAALRMGFFLLNNERSSSRATMQTTMRYFKLAYELSPYDFNALVSLLYVYFHDVEQNLSHVADILKKELAESWSNEELARLYFIKGVYTLLFNTPTKIGVAKAWIKAMDLNKDELQNCFERFASTKRQFKIPEIYNEVLNLPNFCNTLKEVREGDEFEVKPMHNKVRITQIRNMIKTAGRKEIKLEKQKKNSEREKVHGEDAKSASWYWNFKSELASGNSVLISVLGACDAGSAEKSFEILKITETSPKTVVCNAYASFCRELLKEKKLYDIGSVEWRRITRQMAEYNWAFATLFREFERRKMKSEMDAKNLGLDLDLMQALKI